eukprot:359605-Chlamydomonas_euryale.AAC.6
MRRCHDPHSYAPPPFPALLPSILKASPHLCTPLHTLPSARHAPHVRVRMHTCTGVDFKRRLTWLGLRLGRSGPGMGAVGCHGQDTIRQGFSWSGYHGTGMPWARYHGTGMPWARYHGTGMPWDKTGIPWMEWGRNGPGVC